MSTPAERLIEAVRGLDSFEGWKINLPTLSQEIGEFKGVWDSLTSEQRERAMERWPALQPFIPHLPEIARDAARGGWGFERHLDAVMPDCLLAAGWTEIRPREFKSPNGKWIMGV